MASDIQTCGHFIFVFLVLLFHLSHPCSCFSFKRLNYSTTEAKWAQATATWYGSPNGDGSEGGACGYQEAVGMPPFSSMISAGGPPLYRSGRGCGACYKVKCSYLSCSRQPITVVITDSCPGCVFQSVHFDLSGTAFEAMAGKGQSANLLNAGKLSIEYRVPCKYNGVNIAFRVDSGSNHYYFAVVIKHVNGDGSLAGVELQSSSNPKTWIPMISSWGSTWKIDSARELKPPFSLKLRSESGTQITAEKIIPVGWNPGETYTSLVNF